MRIIMLFILLMPLAVSAKRLPPKDVVPVVFEGIEYSVTHWTKEKGLRQNGGYILATEQSSGDEIWVKRIYETQYQQNLEKDIQDVFIIAISIDKKNRSLRVINEEGKLFKVNIDDQAVVEFSPCEQGGY